MATLQQLAAVATFYGNDNRSTHTRSVREMAFRFKRKTKRIATKLAPKEPSFRFFDLPQDIRTRIYNAIPLQIKHRDVEFEGQVCLTLVMRGLPSPILRTCRKANEEAKEIFNERRRREIMGVPLRVIVRSDWDTSLAARHNAYLTLSALAHAIECAKARFQRGDNVWEQIFWPAEDKCYTPTGLKRSC
jgi:hypothetical protein